MEWSFFSSKIGPTALAALEPVIERWNACFQTWLLLTAQLPHLGLWVPVIEHDEEGVRTGALP